MYTFLKVSVLINLFKTFCILAFLLCFRTHHQTQGHVDLFLFSKMLIVFNWNVVPVAKFVFMFLSFRMVFNQLFPGRVLSRVLEIFGSISVWVSSLGAHSKAGSGWALWGLWVQGCCSSLVACLGRQPPLWPVGTERLPSDSARWPAGGSFVSSAPSGLVLLDNGAASRHCLSAHQQGGAARGKNEDEVNVSCVQLSADRRSISENSGGWRGEELHVQIASV